MDGYRSKQHSPQSANRGLTLIELLITIGIIWFLIVFLGSVFDDQKRDIRTAAEVTELKEYENELNFEFTPSFIPITASISSDGVFNVVANGRFNTPLGSLSAEWVRKKILYLEVTLGTETRFYELGRKKFELAIPNSLDGNSHLSYDSYGNIRLVVPRPDNIRFPSTQDVSRQQQTAELEEAKVSLYEDHLEHLLKDAEFVECPESMEAEGTLCFEL